MNSITLSISPGEEQIIWDNSQDIIEDFSLHPLRVKTAGELPYVGATLHELAGKDSTEDADYAIKVRMLGTEDLQFDLRVRRQDANNFISLKVDFLTDTISITKTTAGIETTLDQATHDFKYLGRVRYDFEIWMISRFFYGFVNGFNIVKASEPTFRTEPGLALAFSSFNSDDPPLIYTIFATETENFPDPQIPLPEGSDPAGLFLQFRQSIKEQIENPTERTWETYMKALKFYEQRNVGMPDHVWEELGYPIKKPSAEEWFGNV